MPFEGLIVEYAQTTDNTQKKLDSKKQALEILECVKFLAMKGYKKVGITYSANDEQTKKIRECYDKKEWRTDTKGNNQASVIHAIEELLGQDTWSDLRDIYFTLPITTMMEKAEKLDFENTTAKDLKQIEDFLKENPQNFVIGWQNQCCNNNTKGNKFAIGGATSLQLDDKMNNTIQTTLVEYAKTYPSSILKAKLIKDAQLMHLKNLVETLERELGSYCMLRNRKKTKHMVLRNLLEIANKNYTAYSTSEIINNPLITASDVMTAIDATLSLSSKGEKNHQLQGKNHADIVNSLCAGFTRCFFTNRTEGWLKKLGISKMNLLEAALKVKSNKQGCHISHIDNVIK